MKKKVLVIRGDYLDQAVYDGYEALAKDYSISFLTTTDNPNPIKPKSSMPIFRVKTNLVEMEAKSKKIPFSKQILSKIKRKQFLGFSEYVKDVDIIHTEEEYYWYTKQVIENKDAFHYKIVCTTWENIPFVGSFRMKYELGNILWALTPFWKPEKSDFNKEQREKANKAIDAFIATSERTKEALTIEGYDKEKIRVLMPPKDSDRFSPRPKDKQLMKKYKIKEGDIVIGTQARLVWEKGMYEMIYATYLLLQDTDLSNYSMKCIIVGRGELEQTMKALTKTLGIEKHVIIESNFVPHEQMPRYHSLFDIFCLNSIPATFWQEQIGQALVEAMLSGTATLAARSGSIPEVVGDASILTQPGDFHDLYEKLKAYILDEKLRVLYGTKAREWAIEHFSYERYHQVTKEVYKQVLKS